MVLKKYIGRAKWEIGAGSVRKIFLEALHTRLSRQQLIAWIAAVTSTRLAPYRAKHGTTATIAHHEEVGVSADEHASAPPPGPPPAGARV
jgi:hypothetical protein